MNRNKWFIQYFCFLNLRVILIEEVLDDNGFCFLLGHTECTELDQLFIVDTADGCFMDDLCINMVGIDLRNGADGCFVHNDGVALYMGMAGIVANGLWMEDLIGCTFGNGTGNNAG